MSRRSWVRVELFGQTRTIAEWARFYGHTLSTVYGRLDRKWDLMTALRTEKNPRRRVSINGQTRTVEQWAKRVGLSERGFSNRLLRNFSNEALVLPHQKRGVMLTAFGRTQTLSDWSRETGINRKTLYWRLTHGTPIEQALIAPVPERRREATK